MKGNLKSYEIESALHALNDTDTLFILTLENVGLFKKEKKIKYSVPDHSFSNQMSHWDKLIQTKEKIKI